MFQLRRGQLVLLLGERELIISPEHRLPPWTPGTPHGHCWDEWQRQAETRCVGIGPVVMMAPAREEHWSLHSGRERLALLNRDGWEAFCESYRQCSYYPQTYSMQTVTAAELQGSATITGGAVEAAGTWVSALELCDCQVTALPECGVLRVVQDQVPITEPVAYRAQYVLTWIQFGPRPAKPGPVHLEAPLVQIHAASYHLSQLQVVAEVALVLAVDSQSFQIPADWEVGLVMNLDGHQWRLSGGGWESGPVEYPASFQHDGHLTTTGTAWMVEDRSRRGPLPEGYWVLAEDLHWRVSAPCRAKSARSALS